MFLLNHSNFQWQYLRCLLVVVGWRGMRLKAEEKDKLRRRFWCLFSFLLSVYTFWGVFRFLCWQFEQGSKKFPQLRGLNFIFRECRTVAFIAFPTIKLANLNVFSYGFLIRFNRFPLNSAVEFKIWFEAENPCVQWNFQKKWSIFVFSGDTDVTWGRYPWAFDETKQRRINFHFKHAAAELKPQRQLVDTRRSHTSSYTSSHTSIRTPSHLSSHIVNWPFVIRILLESNHGL